MIQERRPATTIGELDIHLGFLMEELRAIKDRQEDMMQLFATTKAVDEKISALEKRIDEISPHTLWRSLIFVATGITAVAAAFWVIVSAARAWPV
jgi:hypothetical protein